MSFLIIFTFFYNYFRYRHFEILEVTSFQIMKSAMHAGSLVRYRIKLLTKRPAEQLVFDELWIEDRRYAVKISKAVNLVSAGRSEKKQIIFIDSEPDIKYPSVPLPWAEKATSGILLGYLVGDKRKYLRIKDFFTCLPQRAVV